MFHFYFSVYFVKDLLQWFYWFKNLLE